jgi:pyruvate,water dikinase
VSFVVRNGELRDLGGKALALSRLGMAGLPVPEWFAVSPLAFIASLSSGQQETLASSNLEKFSNAISQLAASEEVREQIRTALRELGTEEVRFAVRSSGVEEDSTDHSFAGQLASFLFVDGPSVADKIADVWRSGFSDRILEYRKQRGLPHLPTSAPAVLVQKMVDAEAAGVAFSADPVSGRRAIAVVSAVFGLGTALVGGDAESDVYEINRLGEIVSRAVAKKDICHRFDPASKEGFATVMLSDEKCEQPVLTDAQVREIAALARHAERYFGEPQDIEWALEKGRLYLLQSRPVTTLRHLPDPDGPLNLWENSSIAENYSGVTTPLTFSFARFIYEGGYRRLCRVLQVPRRKIEAQDRAFRRTVGLIKGRVYCNLLNLYRVLALLPGFTFNRRFMEQMIGGGEPLPDEISRELPPATTAARLADLLSMLRMMFALVASYFTLDNQIKRFYCRLDRTLAPHRPALQDMRLDELVAHYHWLQDELLAHWEAPLVNDLFAMIFHGLLRQLTLRWTDDHGGMSANDAIRGEGGIISAEAARRVQAMAELVSARSDLAEALRQAPSAAARKAIASCPELQEAFDSYLQKFGDRCLEELKLESETLEDNPLVLIRNIGELARARKLPRSAVSGPSPAATAERKMLKALRFSPMKKMVLRWVLKSARARVKDRENLRFERTRLFGRVRRIFVEAGHRLHAMGVLECPRDIFYLQIEEITAFVDGTAVSTDLKSLVRIRQGEFESYRDSRAPDERFKTFGPVYHGHDYASDGKEDTVAAKTGEERSGIGCCPGTVRGAVRVVRDPRNAHLPAGSILVADHTDPGWIMLFPSAAGVLMQRGSLLSHSAIVVRELDIPAVVSVPGLLEWLHDDDVVEIDGAKGIVRRLSPQEQHAERSCGAQMSNPDSGEAANDASTRPVSTNARPSRRQLRATG